MDSILAELAVTFYLVASHLNGVVYVYETFIRPCFHVNLQTCSTWFNIPKKTFLLGSSDDFLHVADIFVKENGYEVLDKLITEKVQFHRYNVLNVYLAFLSFEAFCCLARVLECRWTLSKTTNTMIYSYWDISSFLRIKVKNMRQK
ncbi:hypothetical protein GIB67_009284 [Kingdonia uniflora]|uniref:Uncharacterized protein n=1 Tax=Kingdonia uniflora TaxID=39325 RepID=A0A7J7N2M6_9MAGN|nr:hypothetical protein GIB67_009284 [Kingdonia uniflora]